MEIFWGISVQSRRMVKQIAIIIATIVCICLLIINGDKINKHEIDSTNLPRGNEN